VQVDIALEDASRMNGNQSHPAPDPRGNWTPIQLNIYVDIGQGILG